MPRIYFDAKEQGCSFIQRTHFCAQFAYENKRALGGRGPAAWIVEVDVVVACWLAAFNSCSILRMTGVDWVIGGLGVTAATGAFL